MRIAYLECFSGMSGDMFLGALVDVGVSTRLLEETVAALNIGARLEISSVNRSGITATKVDVHEGGNARPALASGPSHQHEHHNHHHSHSHAHDHSHEGPTKTSSHHHGRSLNEVLKIIDATTISNDAKKNAAAMFETLGAAEAKIHGIDVQKVHFHEVGAVDAIVDIVCAAVGAEALGVQEIVCSPLNVGGGTVQCAHGTFPVPAPATVEVLKGVPVFSSGLQAELVTPTGAAIVRTLAKRFLPFPEMQIEKAGYGAGTRDFPGHANVVRLTVGEAQPGLSNKVAHETISVLEANLDDLSPQVFGYVMDRLLEAGSLDVFGVPIHMKKGRPGTLLTVLCRPEDASKLAELIFRETTTLGVRRREEMRQALMRTWVSVSTRWGDVRIKVASMNGTITNFAPEYEDCRRVAEEHNVPLKHVMQEVSGKYLQMRVQGWSNE